MRPAGPQDRPTGAADPLATADDLGRQLGQFVRLLHRVHTRAPELTGTALDRTGYALLRHLVVDGPQRAGALADAVYSDPSTVSRQVGALIEHGLLAREPDPVDGRAGVLAPTRRGHELFEHVRWQRNHHLAGILKDWPPEQCCQLTRLLERFNSDLERYQARPTTTQSSDTERTDTERTDTEPTAVPAPATE